MRVLTVVNNLGIGGTQRVAMNYALGLRRRGIDAALLTHAGGGPREAQLRAAGVELFVTGPGGDWRRTAAAGRAWRTDIVHIHRAGYPNRGESELLRALKVGGAKVIETNVFGRYDWTEGGGLIDAHLLLNRWCLHKWRAWGGEQARGKRVAIVPNAVDAGSLCRVSDAQREAVRRELGVPEGRFLFGRVGQPIRGKWAPSMLTAFADVVRGGKDVGLLLVGAPDDILARVAALPAAARGRVVTLPPTSSDGQLAGYFSAMDGFLHVSRIGESFGMVLCEAMLCGVPVVTLSTPLKDNGQLETVGHRRGGLVALEAGALPRAMTGLMADDTLRAEVRSNGADWVMQRFGIDRVAGQLVEIYEAVLRDGPLPDLPVTDGKWIDEIAALGIGEKPGPAARLAFRLLHQPQVYRGYLGLRRVTARLS